MNIRILFFLPPLLVASMFGDPPRVDQKAQATEQESLQGAWEPIEIIWAGEKYAGKLLAGNRAQITGAKVEFTSPPPPGGFVPKNRPRSVGLFGMCSFVLDLSEKPKAIDLTRVDGGKNIKTLGIYRLDGDLLTICLDNSAVRPKTFESQKDSKAVLITMKRLRK